MITDTMRSVINHFSVGAVASITPGGLPHVSPKGTFVVVDAETLAFSDLRSPQTIANLRHNPALQVSFTDVFRRQCVKVSGTAGIFTPDTEVGSDLRPMFQEKWPTLEPRIRQYVRIAVSKAELITSPVYDDGATAEGLTEHWRIRYAEMLDATPGV